MVIKGIFTLSVLVFPFLYISGFLFPGIVPRVLFMYLVIELITFLFLWGAIRAGKFSFKRSWVSLALVLYVAILFITALIGVDFDRSFWSSYSRMTGLLMWLHYLVMFLIISSVFVKRDWINVFRAVGISGIFLSVISFLGPDGCNLSSLRFLYQGGSLLQNDSYAGIYMVLVFFLSLIGLSFESKRMWKWIYGASLFLVAFNPILFNFSIFWGRVSLSEIFAHPGLIFGPATASSITLWFGILLFAILYLIHKLKNKKHTIYLSFGLLGLMAIVYLYGFSSILWGGGVIQDKFISLSGEVRQVTWERAIDGIKERPVFGYGVENFGYVFDRNLDMRVSIPEHPLWFDRGHNFVIDHLVESGVVGILALFFVFSAVVWTSFRLYLRDRRFYFLAIPFILALHFLQLQTFFQVNSSLFLVFVLLAFLVSHEKNIKFTSFIPHTPSCHSELAEESCSSLSSHTLIQFYKAVIIVFSTITFYFLLYIPVAQNLAVAKIYSTGIPEERVGVLSKINNLWVYPSGTIDLLTDSYIRSFSENKNILETQESLNKKAMELRAILTLYDNYFDKYEDNFRFLLEYARLINFAYPFGIDELARGKEVINMALEISDEYPHPHLSLARNLYYSGEIDEATYLAEFGGNLAVVNSSTQENIGFGGIKSGIKPVKCFGLN